MILDAVQCAPAIFRHVKSAVDAHRGRKGAFVLTGSQLLPIAICRCANAYPLGQGVEAVPLSEVPALLTPE